MNYVTREKINPPQKKVTCVISLTNLDTPGQLVYSDATDEVERILASKDFYEVLLVTRQEILDEPYIELLKKQYKKIALKIHPDKNTHPNSGKAFNGRIYNF